MTISAQPVPILKDNYAWLLKDSETGATAIVDPADAKPIIAALEAAGGRLDMILLTHHHADHTAGTDAHRPVQLVAEDVAQVRRRRPGRDVALGNRQDKGRREVEVLSRRPDLGRARGDGDPGLCLRRKGRESQAKPDHQGQPCGAWARSAVVSHAASRP